MKIVINNVTYTAIKNLEFSPETDITGGSLAINQFVVEIQTQDNIGVGINAYLYDDADNVWAKYWITKAERLTGGWVTVTAESIFLLLDRFKLPAAMYSADPVTDALDDIFDTIAQVYPSETLYTIASSLQSVTISGYCPQQTARERLLWVVFVIGAYIKTYFNEYAEIVPIESNPVLIPEAETFWKPTIEYSDYVTAVKIKSYTYTQGTPQTVDKWVEVNGVYYIQTEQEYTLTNPDVPVTVTENVKEIKSVTLVNSGNVSTILSRLAQYYFKRIEVSADVINNGDYAPGDDCIVNTGDILVSGYIKSASFTFGTAKKSQIKLVQSDTVESANLTIEYTYDNVILRSIKYLLPVGYEYSFVNPYLDITSNGIRRIYRPLSVSASGTITSGGITDQEQMDIAIESQNRNVYIISVDSATEQTGGVVKIG